MIVFNLNLKNKSNVMGKLFKTKMLAIGLAVFQSLLGEARFPSESGFAFKSQGLAHLYQAQSSELFWDQVEFEGGTPLVESIPADEEHVLLTFLFKQSNESVKGVALVGELAEFLLPNHSLAVIPHTDVWYKTVRVRKDLRTTYAFSVNDQNLTPAQAYALPIEKRVELLESYLIDPFNQQEPLNGFSVIGLSNAAKWILKTDVPKGKLIEINFKSCLLSNERKVEIYLPYSYRSDEEYPLIVFLDGDAYTKVIAAPAILDHLIAADKIPESVALFVSSINNEIRNKELSCNALFDQFLVEELLPWVRGRFSVKDDPSQTVVVGASLGGLGATCVAFRENATFGKVLAQSGSFWWGPGELTEGNKWEWLTTQFTEHDTISLELYLEAGLLDVVSIGDEPSILESNRHLRDVLMAKGYDVKYVEFNGGHHQINWRESLADGLVQLLPKNPSKD